MGEKCSEFRDGCFPIEEREREIRKEKERQGGMSKKKGSKGRYDRIGKNKKG